MEVVVLPPHPGGRWWLVVLRHFAARRGPFPSLFWPPLSRSRPLRVETPQPSPPRQPAEPWAGRAPAPRTLAGGLAGGPRRSLARRRGGEAVAAAVLVLQALGRD